MGTVRRSACFRWPESIAGKLFCYVTALETIVDAVLVALVLSFTFGGGGGIVDRVLAKDEGSVLPVYLGLFVLAHLFQFALAVDALMAKNTLQIAGLCIFNTLFLAYSIIVTLEIRALPQNNQADTINILVVFIPVMIGITEVVYLGTFFPLYREFGWSIYKRIGADRGVKKMYMWFQVFICILKFDFFLFVSFSLQLVLLVQQNDLERWLTVAASPITLILLVLGYVAAKKEKRGLMWVFLFGSLVGAGYFIFKLFKFSQLRYTDYLLVFKSLTAFASLCLFALLVTVTVSIICLKNFDHGLKQQMTGSSKEPINENGQYMLETTNADRMSLD